MPHVRPSIQNSARRRFRPRSLLLAGLVNLGFGLQLHAPAWAIDRATLELLTKPLEPALFDPNAALDPKIGTPDQINPTGLTPPSLWWKYEQFGEDLLRYWLSYPAEGETPGRVDLVVDQQIWSSYNYVQRYAFVNQFGTTAKDFGYNLRVFNPQGVLLGAQICQFDSAQFDSARFDSAQFETAPANLDVACTILLNSFGRGAFRGSVTPGALSPTGGDVLQGR